ncbi:MAG: DUF3579 domain-containing protein [Betaproteobacteria bacterium]
MADPPVPSAAAAGKPREFFIHGVTSDGRRFRPSDWAERLCGVLAPYRPGGAVAGRAGMLGYSPYVRPLTIGNVKCVVVDERLRDIEPLAFDFALNFARDNDLPVTEGCSLP